MKFIPVLFVFLFCSPGSIWAQDYRFSIEIDSMLREDTVPWRGQRAAWDYSFIGAYQPSLDAWLFRPPGMAGKLPSRESVKPAVEAARRFLADYKPLAAVDYILQEAAKTRIVILNEAHHQPLHRLFAQSLIPGLKKLGYRFLGMEALDEKDSLINARKYPVLASGYYTREPAMGNLIRYAIASGLNLFAYEATGGQNGKDREIEQAKNIASFLNRHPNAKLFIYCGFDHVQEDSTHNQWVLAMAGRVKALTGIDPLSIDQVTLTETGTPLRDNAFRQAIALNYPAVLINQDGEAFHHAQQPKRMDVQVYHPNTLWEMGRPGWRKLDGYKSYRFTNQISIEYPCQLLAYHYGEPPEEAVPVDLIELENAASEKPLLLNPKLPYRILARNRQGQTQWIDLPPDKQQQ